MKTILVGTTNPSKAAYFKDLLETMEQRIPDIRSHILRSLSDVRPEYLLDKRFLNLPE